MYLLPLLRPLLLLLPPLLLLPLLLPLLLLLLLPAALPARGCTWRTVRCIALLPSGCVVEKRLTMV